MTDARPLAANPDYVRAGEELVWQGRPSLLLILNNAVALIASFVFLGFFLYSAAARAGPAVQEALPVALLGLYLLGLLLVGLRIRRTEYTVTRQGLYSRSGIIGRTVIQTTYDKITDIALKQDVLGRIFGFASLHVNTAGGGTAPLRLEGLRDALGLKDLIEQARENFLRGERGGPKPTPANLPRFVPDRLLMRVTCPTTKRSFKRPQAEAGTSVPCPHCGRRHPTKVAA